MNSARSPVTPLDPVLERRDRADRRRRRIWSIWYGGFHPRRRLPPRRLDDSRFHSLDWYSAHLLAVAVGILLLSAADAFMTLALLLNGADEVNPVMAVLVYRSVALFIGFKMGMTGASVLLMVFLSRYRFMRFLRVELVLYAVLVGYMSLIMYEWWLLKGPPGWGALVILPTGVTFHIASPSAKLAGLREFVFRSMST